MPPTRRSGILESPDPVYEAPALRGLELAVQVTAHVTNALLGEKGLGPWPWGRSNWCPCPSGPQEVGDKAGETLSPDSCRWLCQHSHLAGSPGQGIKQEHNLSLLRRPLPCCGQDPGRAKSSFLHRGARKEVAPSTLWIVPDLSQSPEAKASRPHGQSLSCSGRSTAS